MMAKNIYSRKISTKEADNGFIFILKNKISFFPDLNQEFMLGDEEVCVQSYPCTCRGPERPHKHFYIRWKGLKAGDKIKIIKNDSDDLYQLKIDRS